MFNVFLNKIKKDFKTEIGILMKFIFKTQCDSVTLALQNMSKI